MEQVEAAVGKNYNFGVNSRCGSDRLEFVQAFNLVRHIQWVT
jgi:hypothetical protein